MSECYGCINPNAACPSCKKNFDRMFAERASTKGHQMNRDAIRAKLLALCAIARRKQPLMSLSELVDQTVAQLLALPPAGGVEEALNGIISLTTGYTGFYDPGVEEAMADIAELAMEARAALSPTTLGGES